jgi:uncharacterized protein (DUF342 family)
MLSRCSVFSQVVVHASEESTIALVESCANIRAMTKDIHAPHIGESVQIGQQISSFSISISDELLSSLKMSRVRYYVFLIFFVPIADNTYVV